jgi:hypothetical protein
MTSNTSKPASFKAGLVVLTGFTLAMGACGVYGWAAGENGELTKWVLSIAAGITACVIPFTVIALGRSWSSAGVIPVLMLCMAMQAVSFHNFIAVAVEAPHKASFEESLQPLKDEVTRTTERLDTAQAALGAFPALVLPTCLCPQTKRAETEAWQAQRTPLDAALSTAKDDRQKALDALTIAQGKHQPLAPDLAVWIVGGLLDLSIALGIWALESTRRKLRVEYEAQREAELAAKRKAREKVKAKAPKARPVQPFVPRLVAANDK